MRFTIDKTLLEQMINYLVTRPYTEVAQLIAAIQQDIKSQTGALESKAGFKGLIRKGLILLVVLIGVQLDAILGLQAFCRTAIILFFCGNEGLSIVENLGIMGVPLPDFLRKSSSY